MLLEKLRQKTNYKETPVLNVKNNNKKIFENFILNESNERVAIVYGANASGKSYIARLIEDSFREEKVPVRNVSMKNRASGCIESTLVFGREGKKSTGEASVKVMMKALTSAKEDSDSLVILDEPNLGLSKKFSKALGKYLSTFLNENQNVQLLLVSHDDDFLKTFQEGLNKKASTCGVNTKMTLQEWFDDEDFATLEELLDLPNKSSNQRILIRNKEESIRCKN